MIKSTLSSFVIAAALSLPLTALAGIDSSGLKPQQFTPRVAQSFVNTDVKDCEVLTKEGDTIEGHTFGGDSKTSYTTSCPKDKPVMVSVKRGYAIESGLLSAVTGMSQSSVVTCCPMSHKWVDSKKQDAGNTDPQVG